MSSFELQLRSQSNCGEDYSRQNPIVRQASNSLLAYDVLHRASCLHAQPSQFNNQSSDYCYADAVNNITNPSDSYIYYLPLGIDLPPGTTPSCSSCLQSTMNVFQSQAGNASQPISITYPKAASTINAVCGGSFVNQSLVAVGGGGNGNAAVRGAGFSPALVLLWTILAVWGMGWMGL